MRAVVQRVKSASVTGISLCSHREVILIMLTRSFFKVDNEVISSISRGLMVLVGIGKVVNVPLFTLFSG